MRKFYGKAAWRYKLATQQAPARLLEYQNGVCTANSVRDSVKNLGFVHLWRSAFVGCDEVIDVLKKRNVGGEQKIH